VGRRTATTTDDRETIHSVVIILIHHIQLLASTSGRSWAKKNIQYQSEFCNNDVLDCFSLLCGVLVHVIAMGSDLVPDRRNKNHQEPFLDVTAVSRFGFQ
jgi:hypothetical protein